MDIQTNSLSVSKTCILENFRLSKISDLMHNYSVVEIVQDMMEEVVGGEFYVNRADVFRWVFDDLDQLDEVKVRFLDLVRGYMN